MNVIGAELRLRELSLKSMCLEEEKALIKSRLSDIDSELNNLDQEILNIIRLKERKGD